MIDLRKLVKTYKEYDVTNKNSSHVDEVICVEEEVDGAIIDIAFQYVEDDECVLKSFTNNIFKNIIGTQKNHFQLFVIFLLILKLTAVCSLFNS